MLSLLSDFGTMCEEPETGEFTCGHPMNYHGYDYATVQIGEQCWFAENLRTELYQNGDEVPFVEAAAQWSSLTSGARRIYGSGDANCGVEGCKFHGCSKCRYSPGGCLKCCKLKRKRWLQKNAWKTLVKSASEKTTKKKTKR